ncbi:hypothetical protein F5Y10DRAFT_282214 [Nemania abortiva]|nr:hypothetical protein F5Y10DRAFT_282214 [Nemania abortiva]
MSRSKVDQPGLEVVTSADLKATSHFVLTSQRVPISSYTAPEVVPLEFLNDRSPGPEALQFLEEKEQCLVEEDSVGTNSRYGRCFIIWASVLLLVIISSIVGGAIGSGSNHDSSPTPPSSLTPSSSSPASTSALLLRSNSKLAVSGYRTEGEFFNSRIFYQDEADNLWFSEYKSDGSGWGNSTKVAREGILTNTAVGVTAIASYDPEQYELFFLNKSLLVTGHNFRDGWSPLGGAPDSIDWFPASADPTSSLGTYWPYIALQKPNLTLHLITYTGSSTWQNQTLGVTALAGTSLAIVPQSASYEDPQHAALFYRRADGLLALHSLEFNETGNEPNVDGDSSITIAGIQWSSFGAFAVARENDPNNATNIYILYQTASNDLQYVYHHGDSWQLGPASDALKNADPSTDITCLTQSIWSGNVVLSSAYDMSRCYFLSGGQIKQVGFDGTMWTDMGNVPLL